MPTRDPSELLTLAPHMRGRMCYILIGGLRDPDLIVRRKNIPVSCDRLLIKMGKMGLLDSIKPGVWKINLDYLRKVSYIVSDDLFDKIADPEVVFEYKKKLGKYSKNITYDEQRAAWSRRDKASKKKRMEVRARIEKEGDRDSEVISEILFVGGNDGDSSL